MAITIDPEPVPLSRATTPTAVMRYDGSAFQPLPFVDWSQIDRRQGSEPIHASFHYVSDNSIMGRDPIWFDQVLPMGRIGNPNVVQDGDRIVVVTLGPDGKPVFLFDGFAIKPQATWSGQSHHAQFDGIGVEMRLWDRAIPGPIYRDGSDPTNPTKNVGTGLEIVINPVHDHVILGNMIGHVNWYADDASGQAYPVFIDPKIKKSFIVDGAEYDIAGRWTLAGWVKYLLSVCNDETYVKNPDYSFLDKILAVYTPTAGDFFDIDNPSTYNKSDIYLPTNDYSDEKMPDLVHQILNANGYVLEFGIATEDDRPVTRINIWKLNDPKRDDYKDIYLQAEGGKPAGRLDPVLSNVESGSIEFDSSQIVNQVRVDTDIISREGGFILTPMYRFDPSDTDKSNQDKFKKSNKNFAQFKDIHRFFGFDECGEGHQVLSSGGTRADGARKLASVDWDETPGDLSPILGTLGVDFVPRRRPGHGRLWSKDAAGEFLRAELYISIDYVGPMPGVWDGQSGTWYRCGGGFAVDPDRLGVWINVENPNNWKWGDPPRGTPKPISNGHVRIIDWIASSVDTHTCFFALMLVTRIDSDQHLNVVANKRAVSPTQFTIEDRVNMRQKYKPGIIHYSSMRSPNVGNPDAPPVIVGNELDDAKYYAATKREHRQLGSFAGQVVIPWLTNAYRVGDRLRSIKGREMSLQVNTSANGNEMPVYPRVIGITWRNGEHGQSTVLIPTDRRADHGQ